MVTFPRITKPTASSKDDSRNLRLRLDLARQERHEAMLGKMSAETLRALRVYQQEKARAAAKGRPTLPTIDEYRNGTASPDQHEHQSENRNA